MAVTQDLYGPKNVLDEAAVTNSYQAIDLTDFLSPAPLAGFNQLVIYTNVALGPATSIEILVEFSPDGGTTWIPESVEAITGSSIGLTAVTQRQMTGNGGYRMLIPFKDPLFRIRYKGTSSGGFVGTTLSVWAGLAIQ